MQIGGIAAAKSPITRLWRVHASLRKSSTRAHALAQDDALTATDAPIVGLPLAFSAGEGKCPPRQFLYLPSDRIEKRPSCDGLFSWSWWRGSDPRPADYESAALPLCYTSEPLISIAYFFAFCKGFYAIPKNIFQKRASRSLGKRSLFERGVFLRKVL